jgi:hypothetical protein
MSAHSTGYLVNVPSTRKIYNPTDVYFDEDFNSTLAYDSNQYLKGTLDKGLLLHPTTFGSIFATDELILQKDGVTMIPLIRYMSKAELVSSLKSWAVLFCVRPNSMQPLQLQPWKLSMLLRALPSVPASSSGCDQVRHAVVPGYICLSLTFKTMEHEYNQGAIRFANMETGRQIPRSKFCPINCHWFRSWVKPNKIETKLIDSKLQKAVCSQNLSL